MISSEKLKLHFSSAFLQKKAFFKKTYWTFPNNTKIKNGIHINILFFFPKRIFNVGVIKWNKNCCMFSGACLVWGCDERRFSPFYVIRKSSYSVVTFVKGEAGKFSYEIQKNYMEMPEYLEREPWEK
jgi:hypothetical protein